MTRILAAVAISALVLTTCTNGSSEADFDLSNLRSSLHGAGIGAPHPEEVHESFPGATGYRLCVAGLMLHVFRFGSRQERVTVSDSIAPTGSPIGRYKIEWIGPPHFYARGRLIVLTLNNARRLNALLADHLGRTLTPKVKLDTPWRGLVPSGARKAERCSSNVAKI